MVCLLSQMPLPLPPMAGISLPWTLSPPIQPPPQGYRSQLVSGGCHGLFQSGQVNISHLQGREEKQHLNLRDGARETTFHRISSKQVSLAGRQKQRFICEAVQKFNLTASDFSGMKIADLNLAYIKTSTLYILVMRNNESSKKSKSIIVAQSLSD